MSLIEKLKNETKDVLDTGLELLGERIYLTKCSVQDYEHLQNLLTSSIPLDKTDPKKPKPAGMPDTTGIIPKLLLMTICDSEGTLIFEQGNSDHLNLLLNSKEVQAINAIGEKAWDYCGFNDEDLVDEKEKNLE